MEDRRRHEILWTTLRPVVRLASKLIFNFSTDVCREEGPLLILPNHNADLDPLFVISAFPKCVYFVASEHVLRSGAASKLLSFGTKIIPRQKGGSASATVRGIIRNLHDGYDVCIFPEGNRSWDGVTRPIIPSTGKMARMSGAKLVTYRTEGVYFSNPRWSGGSIRRGRTRGRIVGVYEPEYLKSLTPKAVQELIERDLYEDAYGRQRKKPVKFRGRRLAEHLETLLFICPNCRAEGQLESSGNYFYCKCCGTKLRYTEEGFFVGDGAIFDSVLDWNIWQTEVIKEKCAAAENEPIFSDDNMKLFSVRTGEGETLLAEGTMTLYRDRLELPDGESIGVHDFSGMSLRGPQHLYFSSKEKNYLVKCDDICCTSKYLTACKMFDSSLQYGI